MAILTNQKPTTYRNLYENTGPAFGFGGFVPGRRFIRILFIQTETRDVFVRLYRGCQVLFVLLKRDVCQILPQWSAGVYTIDIFSSWLDNTSKELWV